MSHRIWYICIYIPDGSPSWVQLKIVQASADSIRIKKNTPRNKWPGGGNLVKQLEDRIGKSGEKEVDVGGQDVHGQGNLGGAGAAPCQAGASPSQG